MIIQANAAVMFFLLSELLFLETKGEKGNGKEYRFLFCTLFTFSISTKYLLTWNIYSFLSCIYMKIYV